MPLWGFFWKDLLSSGFLFELFDCRLCGLLLSGCRLLGVDWLATLHLLVDRAKDSIPLHAVDLSIVLRFERANEFARLLLH